MSYYVVILLSALAVLIAVFLWPHHGGRARWRRSRALAKRVLVEDCLKHIHARKLQGNLATAESLAGALHLKVSKAVEKIAEMEAGGLLRITSAGLDLTPTGNRMALQVIILVVQLP